MNRDSRLRPAHAVCTVLIGTLLGCAPTPPDAGAADFAATLEGAVVPAELQPGEASYDASCAACHGAMALGTSRGPPLVHRVYEPSHHADIAFYLAVQRGVRAHHWSFGDMPPVPGVSREETEVIVAYIRFLQRTVGIE